MTTEMVLLLISMITNIIIVVSKKIKLIYTPCLYIDCGGLDYDDEYVNNTNNDNSNLFKKVLSKITPRKKKQELNEVKTDIKTENMIV